MDRVVKQQTKVTMLLATGIAVAIGAAIGLGGFTFVYAKGYSYLSNDPNACANCHIMRDHLDAYVEIEPSLRRHVQRLPHAAWACAEVLHQSGAWLLSFARLHHG